MSEQASMCGVTMVNYIGVKRVQATPLNLGDYNKYRGWDIPSDEDPAKEGYLVVYPDGYKSWCPKGQFEDANRAVDGLSFGHAIEAAKLGLKIARSGWNGKSMFVVAMPPLQLPPHSSQEPGAKVNDRTAKFIGEDTPLNCVSYFAMYSAQKEWIPGWLASQTDMLADDWCIVS